MRFISKEPQSEILVESISRSMATGIEDSKMKKVCIIGDSGKLEKYMIQHCQNKNYDAVGVCREKSMPNWTNLKTKSLSFPVTRMTGMLSKKQ